MTPYTRKNFPCDAIPAFEIAEPHCTAGTPTTPRFSMRWYGHPLSPTSPFAGRVAQLEATPRSTARGGGEPRYRIGRSFKDDYQILVPSPLRGEGSCVCGRTLACGRVRGAERAARPIHPQRNAANKWTRSSLTPHPPMRLHKTHIAFALSPEGRGDDDPVGWIGSTRWPEPR